MTSSPTPTPGNTPWHATPQWRRLFLILGITILVVVLLIGAYTLFRPLRANQLAGEAVKLLEKNDLSGARQKVMAAKELSGRSITVARAMAQVWGRLSPSQVVPMWERAVELSGGAKEDKQGLAMALLAAGETERARETLQELLTTAGNDPQTSFVQVNWLIAAGRQSDAFNKISQLIDQYPTNENFWKAYAAIAPMMGQKGLDAYTTDLQKLKKQPGQIGLWALEELARLSTPAELEKRLDELFARPDASRASQLFAYQMRHAKAKLPYEAIRKALERDFNMALTADRQELARFYRSIGDNQGILLLISPRQAITTRDDLMLYMDALAGTGKWQALIEILNIDKIPLENYWREIFKARAYGALGQQEKSELAWRQSLVAAGNNSKALSDIAYYLITLGAIQEVDEVMPRLISNAGAMERTLHYQLWLQVVTQARDTTRAQAILEKMTKEYPKNSSIQNDYIYYSLLLNKNNKNGDWVAQAYQLAKDNPAVLAHRMTLALALLKTNQAPKALEVINSTRIADWNLMPVGYQLLRAAVLNANGQAAPKVENSNQALTEEQALGR